ncbi:hypothetical protein T492DRAFT_873342 [Pavlovales sp. CCMP2436]|nr:hypothetical protein T492DRAFT_873342 [Pavlovales sp. CCMP2436]
MADRRGSGADAQLFGAFSRLQELCPPDGVPAPSAALQTAVEVELRALAAALDAPGLALVPVQAATLLHQASHVLASVRVRAAGMGAASANDEEGTRLALGVVARLARSRAAAAVLLAHGARGGRSGGGSVDAVTPSGAPARDSGEALRLTLARAISDALDVFQAARGAELQHAATEALGALVGLIAQLPQFCAFALPGISAAVARAAVEGRLRSSATLGAALRAWGDAIEGALTGMPALTAAGLLLPGGAADDEVGAPTRVGGGASASAAAISLLRRRAAPPRAAGGESDAGSESGGGQGRAAEEQGAHAASEAGAAAASADEAPVGACLVRRTEAWAAFTARALAPLLARALAAAASRGQAAGAAAVALAAAGVSDPTLAPRLIACLPTFVDTLAAAAADGRPEVRTAARAALRAATAARAPVGTSLGPGAGREDGRAQQPPGPARELSGLLNARLLAYLEELPDCCRGVDEDAKLRSARAVRSLVAVLGAPDGSDDAELRHGFGIAGGGGGGGYGLGGGGGGAARLRAALAPSLPRVVRALCAALEPASALGGGGALFGAAEPADAEAGFSGSAGLSGHGVGGRLPSTRKELDANAARAISVAKRPALAHVRR